MITARGLTKYYGDKCAIHDLDFTIDSGEIVGFLGLNGAGKTTTLRILTCLLQPSSGSVRVKNFDIIENPHEIRRMVGFLPDTPPLYEEMTVASYLSFAGRLRGLDAATTKRRLGDVMEVTGTREVSSEIIGNLSHGYRQRVGIGQAMIHDPEVLIFDEPISGLDPRQIVQMRQLVRDLGGKHTILVSSHILSEISQTCDRILVINDGSIVASGTEEELAAGMAGSKRLRIVVRGEQAKALELLRGLEGVKDCTTAQSDATATDAVPLEVTTSTDIREQISRELVQAGFGLLALQPVEELESFFLQLTHGPN